MPSEAASKYSVLRTPPWAEQYNAAELQKLNPHLKWGLITWNEINRYRAMPSEELDELIKKEEEFIKKEIAEARARKQ